MRYAILLLVVFSCAGFAQSAADFGSQPSPGPAVQPLEGIVSVCDDPAIIRSDDGTAENGYSGNTGTVSEVTLVDRFDRSDFPANLIDTICIGWVSLAPDGVDFDLVVFDDDGVDGAPGTLLASAPASISGLPIGLPATIAPYDFIGQGSVLPASGSFYIGVRYTPVVGGLFVAADESGAVGAAGGYVFFDTAAPDDVWQAIQTAFPAYSALFVRALPGEPPVVLPESQPVPTMGNWSLMLMALALALVAVVVLRAR